MMKSPYSPYDHGAAYYLFQNSADPIILTDESGLILQSNKRTFVLLGYGLGELEGRHIAEIFDPEQSLPDFSLLPSDSPQVFDGIIPANKNRDLLHVKVFATKSALDKDHVVQWMLHDITRQVELDQLRQDLAAMLVHDLQGPLGNLLYSLELVTNELPEESSDTVRLMLDTAYRSSQHLQYLVQSLMDISHLEAGHPLKNLSAINVSSLVDYVYAFEEPNLETRGVSVSYAFSPDLPDVLAEESMLRRVLLNLLDNALKHSQSGYAITIKAEMEAGTNMVRFSVVDRGKGVPEAYRDLIFEKFQRVRNSTTSSGLGLGLAFCRLAIEAHGGQIWVEDAPSGGACFCFTIPTAAEELSAPADPAHD